MLDTNTDAIIVLSPVNRFYFTGFSSSFGAVVLTKSRRLFFTDSRYLSDAEKNADDFEVIGVQTGRDLYGDIAKKLNETGNIKKVGYEDEFLTVSMFKDFKEQLKEFTLKPVSSQIRKKREIKSLAEIEKIRTAQKIAERSLKKIMPLIKAGVTEKELATQLLFAAMSLGAEGMSFDTIIAFGENTAVPHHHPSSAALEKNDIILIDFGVKYEGYCSDMTRTFCIGEPNEKIKEIHAIVLAAQGYALKHIKAGMTGKEADSLAREYIKANGYDAEFSHSLGHGLGLDIHESPYASMHSLDALEEGAVISVEPGIYLKGIGGVRIEDIVVVKKDGVENLTEFDKSIDL